jgi:hypothetical protein
MSWIAPEKHMQYWPDRPHLLGDDRRVIRCAKHVISATVQSGNHLSSFGEIAFGAGGAIKRITVRTNAR